MVSYTCAGQAVLSILVWLGIVYMNSVVIAGNDANIVSLSWLQWFFSCKYAFRSFVVLHIWV